MAGPVDPDVVRAALHRPSSVLWDGTTTWVLLEGYEVDVEDQAARAASAGLTDVVGPPELPHAAGRWQAQRRPAKVASWPDRSGNCALRHRPPPAVSAGAGATSD
jgi:hypothetical protein